MSEEMDLEELLNDEHENKDVWVYLVWSIDRVSKNMELRAVCSNKSRAKKYSREITRDKIIPNEKDMRAEIEKRDIDHLYAESMMGYGKEWSKK